MNFPDEFWAKVHTKVHIMRSRKDYSISFYTGGVNVDRWSELSEEEKTSALSKPWKIIWWYRNPLTGKMVRQKDVKKGVNLLKTMHERMKFMRDYRRAMKETFDEGYTPDMYINTNDGEYQTMDTRKAFALALEIKKELVGDTTYKGIKLDADNFLKFLRRENRDRHDIKLISRKIVSDYLDHVLKRTSAVSRNRARKNLSSLFTVLSNKFLIETNFIKTDIPKVKSQRKSDPRFTWKEMQKLSAEMEKQVPYLKLYSKVACYMFMRSIEVARLRVGDIDLKNREIYFDQKTKHGKRKAIPAILIDELSSYIGNSPEESVLFTPYAKPDIWNVSDVDKRGYHGKMLTKVKRAVGISDSRGFHAMRHFYITETYLELRNKGFNESRTVEELSKITGHDSDAIHTYIHVNDIEKPEDWSELITKKL
ncbi:MAG: tyrosine-type recombinase/integrase [Bacteroidota bacterium]